MKKYKIMFWVSTGLIFLTQGLLEVYFYSTGMATEGIIHFGYPAYFVTMLVIAKALGSLALIIPQIPKRIKEWAFAGFGFDFIAAFISGFVVDGFNAGLVPPIVAIVILCISYTTYHKLNL